MVKVEQNSLNQIDRHSKKSHDTIIQQTLKRKRRKSNTTGTYRLCPLTIPNPIHISNLIYENKYFPWTNRFKISKKKRLLTWSDLRFSKRIIPNKHLLSTFKNIAIGQNNFIIVWLYTNKMGTNEEYMNDILMTDYQIRLDTLIDDIKIFHNFKECFYYLSIVSTKKILCIISGSSGKTLVPLILEHEHIQFIYIYYIHAKNHIQWNKNHRKVRGIFNNKNNLIDALLQDLVAVSLPGNVSPSMSIFSISNKEKSIKDLNKEQAKFIWFQLLLQVLIRLPSRKIAKTDMINECKSRYNDDQSELKKIDEFDKSYESSDAIEWYTRDSFLYRLLNQAFRLQDIDIIFKFRFIIKDMYNQLYHLHKNVMSTTDEKLYVYRGQGIFRDEFENLKNNIGGFISINSFFSTTTSSTTALEFAGDGSGRPLIESVLFEIEIDTTMVVQPFANIKKQSYLDHENEILFSMGNVFQIDSIDDLTENIWVVKLILSTENEQINQLMQYFKKDIETTTDLFTFGVFLFKMGDFLRAEKYFQIVVRQFYINPIDKAKIFNCIGVIDDAKGDYHKALKFYKKALTRYFKYSTIFHNSKHIAAVYNNIGHLYDNKGRYSLALKYYQKALDIDRTLSQDNENQLSIAYGNIGCVQVKQQKFRMALKNFQRALKIRFKCLPSNHPDIAITYNNIGQIHFQIGNYTDALNNYKQALNIQQLSLIPNNSSVATTLSNIGELYSEIGYYSDALDHYKKAVTIQQKILPLNHPDLAVMFDNIGCVYVKEKDYPRALEYFQKALAIELISLSKNHPALATTYNNIGNTYYQQENYLLALQYFRKTIQIRLAIFPKGDLSFASVFNNIALIYYQRTNYTQALKYHKKSLYIKLLHLPRYHPDLGSSYNNIGLIYHRKGDYLKALYNYEKCVSIRLQTLPHNHPDIGITYENIGMVYHDKEDFENALVYLQKGLDILLPLNHPDTTIAYHNLIKVYLKQKDINIAKLYYNKLVDFQKASE